jgi:Reverse transcriptase (RNA-dependent DNA polymerase)
LANIGLKDDPDHESESIFTAKELNTYYYTLALQPSQLSIFCPSTQNLGSTRQQFSFRNVDNIEERNAIFNVKSMAGIFLEFIKFILPLILPCITHIFNTILTKSLFPKTWKILKVLPISKVKNPCFLSDYRPISILPSLSKALELLMKDQIMPFVIYNSYLNRFQFGFRSAHSTTTALLNVTNGFRQTCEYRFVAVLLLLDFYFTTSFAINSCHPIILIQRLFL